MAPVRAGTDISSSLASEKELSVRNLGLGLLGEYCGRTKVRPTCCKHALQADPFSPIDSSTEHFEDSAGTLK